MTSVKIVEPAPTVLDPSSASGHHVKNEKYTVRPEGHQKNMKLLICTSFVLIETKGKFCPYFSLIST